jgi:hypothetical protein
VAEIPEQYKKDFAYLRAQSEKGALRYNNAILQKLEKAAKSLPGLQRALDTLRIQY